MSKETALFAFLNAKGKRVSPGDDIPDESEANLKLYRDRGLIGVAEAPAKPSKAAKKKAAAKKST